MRRQSLLRFLTSMNLAVTLLVMLAVASVIGTIVPQNLPLQEYVIRFGPFWADVFNRLGVFNVYASGWFTALLLFLVFSLSLCVIEHVPVYLRQWRHRRAFSMPGKGGETLPCRMTHEQLKRALEQKGLRVSVHSKEGALLLSAEKGHWRGLGYFLLHGGLLIILAGALIDTNPLLKLRLLTGEVRPAPFDTLPDQADPHAILPPDSGAFRASISLRPGEKADQVYLTTGDGYLIRKLPFVIAVDDFRIDYYATGMPKGYTSRVSLFDRTGRLLYQGSLSVNHPLSFEGYTLYQSTFDDGGSLVTFRARQPGGMKVLENRLQVGETMRVTLAGKQWMLTLSDFQLHTVIRRSGGRTLNRGPRMVYRLTDPQGRRIWLENYLAPRRTPTGEYRILGVKHAPSEPFRTIAVPLHEGEDAPFWRWLATLASQGGEDQASLLVRLFLLGGFGEIEQFVEKNIEENDRRVIKKLYISMLLDKLNTTLNETLPQADAQWRNDAIMAADALFTHGVPLWLQMTGFEQRLETGLLVARYPGKPLIWLGSLLLSVGVFLMLYTKPVRIWIHLTGTPPEHEMKMVIKCKDSEEAARLKEYIKGLCRGPDNEHAGNQHG